MNSRLWSFIHSWSRVGINAALFLIATRVLTLTEIGIFATAFAPIRLIQSLQKAGIGDAVVMFGDRGRRWLSLFALSLGVGLASALTLAVIGYLYSPILLALSCIPIFHAFGTVPEAILRHRLAIRSLAIRTLIAQSFAAVFAVAFLFSGYGLWSLVAFALISAALTNLLSILLARWSPKHLPRKKDIKLILPKTTQIIGRVAITSGQIPLVQLCIGLTLGPAAAGSFQIATRMFDLIEALTLSPLRFIVLPRLKRASNLRPALQSETFLATTLAVWIWAGTFAATPEILNLLVGDAHALAVVPTLHSLIPLGIASAAMMPLTQALIAQGQTTPVLIRSILTFGLTVVLLPFALNVSPTACALVLTFSGLTGQIWLARKALTNLQLCSRDFSYIAHLIGIGGVMVAALFLAPALSLWEKVVFGTAIYVFFIAINRPKWSFA